MVAIAARAEFFNALLSLPLRSGDDARTMPRWVLGLNKYDHDASAVLLRDGVPFVGVAKERLTRRKHDGGLVDVAAGYCLDAAGIGIDDVDVVVQNSYALDVPSLEHDLLSRVHELHLPPTERSLAAGSRLFRNADVVTISHHLAHAWSAFACSPFEEGVVMVVDGVGSHRHVAQDVPAGDAGSPTDREAESYYRFAGTDLVPLGKQWLRPVPSVLLEEFTRLEGLGACYSRVSEYVFGHWNRCGEVMGLAAYGGPDPAVPPLMGVREGRSWSLARWPAHLSNPFFRAVETEPRAERDAAWAASPHMQEWRNVAWRAQTDVEEALLERARGLHAATGARRLVAAGGVMLNCVANARIAEEGPFDDVWIQPACGDTGIALGCALYGEHALLGKPRRHVMRSDSLGRTYSPDDVDAALAAQPFSPFLKVSTASDVAAETAEVLAAGKVVGWFQGGSELGPRALGNRSILCDPRDRDAKERLNARVKHRQAFRPFAPAIPMELADEWFEPGPPSRHMLFTRRVREEKRGLVPAVVHVDGSARVQTVEREARPLFHALLSAFHARTDVPILVNTSFNVRGEPIVETPMDALLCFVGTDIDVLVMGDRVVRKRALLRPVRGALLDFWRRRGAADPSVPARRGTLSA